MEQKIFDITYDLEVGLITAEECKEKLLLLFGDSGCCLPSHKDMSDKLEQQFFNDYNGFDKAKRFYFKRGWRMCYTWLKQSTNNR